MIRLLYVLPAFLILTTSCGRSDTAGLGDINIEQLSVIRASLKQAMLEGDIDVIKRAYHKDYELVTRKGILQTRTERIEMLESGKLRYLETGEETEVTVKLFGNVAVVRGVVSSANTVFDGESRKSVPRRFTEIWEHKNGEWREVGRQSTAIASSAR